MTSVTDFAKQRWEVNEAIEKLTRDELVEIALTMEDLGGHFASALATAFIRADPSNKARILSVFGEVFINYIGLRRS